jgi:pimeloyl-ACP methyl ester carboxylesterase
MSDGIVILHGIYRTNRCLRGMASFFEEAGFNVLNLNYPSTKYPIEILTDIIHRDIAPFVSDCGGRIHFFGYSMGGLLIRSYLHRYRPDTLGRVVMVATPNQGSEMADFLQHWWVYKKLYGAAGQQLITSQDAFAHHFGQADYELGIIAGITKTDPITSRIMRQPSDGKVSVESTKLNGMSAHMVMPSSHMSFVRNQEMWKQTLYFMQNGAFKNAP